ncbi:MAG: methyltransferase domain-containing protein [Deltaproteobacteria bacterium]|nr:methyltransferase domain-containing protein [Deltaproteobacteria bacterium]
MSEIFDDWPERYDQWFETPIGRVVREAERGLLRDACVPGPGERILDVGCGTGVFTVDLLAAGAAVTGVDLSLPMLRRLARRAGDFPFRPIQGDMRALPVADAVFDKAVSVTAIEFLPDARGAVAELFRATRPGGSIVVATLNALSPWAARRREAAAEGHPIFRHVRFRTPDEIAALRPDAPRMWTAVHFLKGEDSEKARAIEADGQTRGLMTGAFLLAHWVKVDTARPEGAPGP